MTNKKGIKRLSVMLVVALLLSLVPATLTFAQESTSDTSKIEAFVERLYTIALGRASEAEGKAYWVDQLATKKKTAIEVVANFTVDADEFNAKGYTDDQFMDILYKVLMDREADAEGKDYWLSELAAGGSRLYVIYAMMLAPQQEFQAICDAAGIKVGRITIAENDYPLEVTAVASGASKITVNFSRPVDTAKAIFEVKQDSFAVTVKSAEWNESKTQAVLTKSFGYFFAGSYSVTVKGLASNNIVAPLTFEAEKIASIEITSKSLIKTSATTATASYTVKNQYGEDISASAAISGVSSIGTVVAAGGTATVTAFDLDGVGGPDAFPANAAASLTLYSGLITATTTLSLSDASSLVSVTLGNMVLPDNYVRLTGAVNNVVITYEAYDQYGNRVYLPTDKSGITFISGPYISAVNVVNDPANPGQTLITVNVDQVPFEYETNLAIIVHKNGSSSKTSFKLYPVADLVDFTLQPDNAIIKAGTAYKVYITAVDTYGNSIAADDLATMDAKFSIVTLNPAVATVAADVIQSDGTNAYIQINPLLSNQVTSLFVTLKANARNLSVPIAVREASIIAGMNVTTTSLKFAPGGKGLVKATFVDQYGQAVTADASYTVSFATSDASVVAAPADASIASIVSPGVEVVANAGISNKSATLTVTLKKGATALDAQTVSISVIEVGKTTLTYEISDIPTLDDRNLGGKGVATISVTAKDSAGNQVFVPGSVIKDIKTSSSILNVDVANAQISAAGTLDAGKEETAVVTVIVENYDGTASIATRNVTVSKKAYQAIALTIYDPATWAQAPEEVYVAAAAIDGKKVDFYSASAALNASFVFVAANQFGAGIPVGYFIITNDNTGAGVNITNDGVVSFTTIANAASGESFNITGITETGLVKTIKVIIQ
jgi:hypothetical protein